MNYFSEFGHGFKIIIFGSPLYFLLAVDILNGSIAQFRSLNFESLLPLWSNIPISIAFIFGLVLFFTSPDKQEKKQIGISENII